MGEKGKTKFRISKSQYLKYFPFDPKSFKWFIQSSSYSQPTSTPNRPHLLWRYSIPEVICVSRLLRINKILDMVDPNEYLKSYDPLKSWNNKKFHENPINYNLEFPTPTPHTTISEAPNELPNPSPHNTCTCTTHLCINKPCPP